MTHLHNILRIPRPPFFSFWSHISLFRRFTLVFLPILALLLICVFAGTRKSLEAVVNSATARNTRIQAHALGFAIGQSLAEARNQLLVLAAGSMQKDEMIRRMQFRTKINNARYREVAFMDADRKERYLLLNYNGELINIPPEQADSLAGSPFRAPGNIGSPDEVTVTQPMEVVYPMMHTPDGMHGQLTLQVIRFYAPVLRSDGTFHGVLILSLDLSTLRDTISNFSQAGADAEALQNSNTHTVYVDKEGWMIFQDAEHGKNDQQSSLDTVRAGFRGDFGRPGYSTAFRPSASEYYSYWTMMNDIQHGKSGKLSSLNGDLWGDGSLPVENVSFAPVTYHSTSNGPAQVVGAVVVLDSTFTFTQSGAQLSLIYFCAFLLAMFFMTLALFLISRSVLKPLFRLNRDILDEADKSLVSELPQTEEPKEVHRLRTSVNLILERLQFLEQDRDLTDSLTNVRLQMERVKDFPKDFVPPEDGIVGKSPEIKRLRNDIAQAAKVMEDVLVVGETGTGKELVSRAIHNQSKRKDGPFITINCGALDEGLLMDTLFGHVKGAYTEAKQPRKGAFLAAEGGTLMLDEIGNATLRVQQALLRALSDRCIHPLGSDEFIKFDTRVIAATNADLQEEVHRGTFREDLYFRLAVITIKTPPLRDHKRDIPYMTVAFLKEGLAKAGEQRDIPDISRGALSKMMHYHWPGNVRELRNCVMRTLAYCDGDIILPHCVDIGAQNEEKGDGNQNRTPTELLQKAWERGQESAGPAQEASGAASVPLPAPSPDPEKRDTAQADPVSPDSGPCEAARRSPDTKSASEEIPGARGLNSRMRAALTEILKRESLSRQDYQDIAGKDISMRTAQYDLQELVKAGFLRKEGRGPALRYIVIRSEKNAPSGQEDSI